MSHQTGITANENLKKFFGKCRDGRIRTFKICIENEQLVLAGYKETKGNWKEDYDKHVKPFAELGQPSYIMYRLDTKAETGGYNWILISWSPDDSPVRQKMLYASTKATLKKDFGSSQIKEEIHATILDEVTFAGLERHRHAKNSPAPRTRREEELNEMVQSIGDISLMETSKSSGTLSSVSMPLQESVGEAFHNFGRNVNYVRIKIDIQLEKIVLDYSGNIEVQDLPSHIPEEMARYHLYQFRYFKEAKHNEAIFFIYSMPGYSVPIKERMLYSSCKAPLLETVEDKYRIKIDKKLEIDIGKDLTHDFLMDELYPKSALSSSKVKFDKPKGPPNRGAKRITKSHQ